MTSPGRTHPDDVRSNFHPPVAGHGRRRPSDQERRDILPRQSPPVADRAQIGLWALDSVQDLASVRAEVLRLCVRVPPVRLPLDSPQLASAQERIAVTLTELVANAFRHAEPPVTVRLACTPQAWLLEVLDHTVDSVPERVEASPHEAGGRGLAIVDALSVDSGWTVEDGVKTVWSEVPDQPTQDLLHRLGYTRT